VPKEFIEACFPLRIERYETIPDSGGEPDLFDFGGTIEEIKASCTDETHFEPPVPPTFAQAG